ncbi:NCS1 family nucleobase:cation symporter-1 [Alkalihalobacillus oceani]|uniref:NCS1 family nucleobase:cation symporter-1 n=1 Tax=Halalkalibacter oceani TaxID=1653776 RepID=A0A9X2DQ08_9BACI|nr:NCS1 family nucleobase:cation symporter-1 [Halalkalibacter oceani]MCM3712993.1 NCS1 family nucleobase:cation symporter-1 [Halalkalibacter oceani]
MEHKNLPYVEKINNPDPTLYNKDLAPVPLKEKTWTWWAYAAIWMGIVHNINQWIIVAIMIDQGMSFWQALSVVCFAFGIVFVVLIANSIVGTKYGVPFPVIIRAAFGPKAALIPIFIRGVLGVFWFGVFMYLASETIDVAFGAILPSWSELENIRVLGMGLNTAIGYGISIILHFLLITHGIERIKRFELWAGPLIMIIAIGLVFWAMDKAGGFMPLVSIESTIPEENFWRLFFLSATGIIGTVATLIVNIPDLTRFARSQKDQIIGQFIGVPLMFVFFSIISLLVTVGSVIAYGEAIFDPIHIVERLENPIIVFICALVLLASVLGLNAATNAIAVGYDLAAVAPKVLTFSRAGVVAIIIGVLSAPWLWYGNADTMNNIMGVLGANMGPVAGIMLVDFYLIRKRKYDVQSLFVRGGQYNYRSGWNFRGIIAFVVGFLAALIGLIIPALEALYAYNWFLGLFVGGTLYYVLMTKYIEKEEFVVKDAS